MQTKHYIWLAALVGLLIGFGAWFLFGKTATAPGTSTATSTATTTTDGSGSIGIVTEGNGATVGEVSTAPKPPAIVAFAPAADVSADAKDALQIQYNTLTSQIKAAPTRVDLWLSLGTVYKIAEQYDAAISAWTYVTKGPGTINYIAYGNLGDLYLNFTHDYQKAVVAYKAALSYQPGNPDYQSGLKTAQAKLAQ